MTQEELSEEAFEKFYQNRCIDTTNAGSSFAIYSRGFLKAIWNEAWTACYEQVVKAPLPMALANHNDRISKLEKCMKALADCFIVR